ncbi:hypothetical protein PBAL39_18714 [Pedobacter sp. BAL39]|uniref:YdcF family protein n=1 Tax=Pedobacter sp. BAL39 TaxID=391596 RepID=UPI000155980B|nr:YdcF family protein [Pedobacter sp. BAL39]EDM36935.1 hypothetical protein PBAL39_18714 [Pedobacter sp. BAL39]
MKRCIIILFFLLISVSTFAQLQSPDPRYRLVTGVGAVAQKNYYFLTLLGQTSGLKQLLAADKQLCTIRLEKQKAMEDAVKNCGKDVACYINAAKFSDEEVKAVSARLAELYQKDNALANLVTKHLIPSGCYQLGQNTDLQKTLINAWEQDARAINHTIDVYAGGAKPNYVKIDSISFNVRDKRYPELLALNEQLSVKEARDSLFFSSSMLFALHSLEINERNQAGEYEPMTETVNKAAYEHSKKIKWDQYQYTLILVPGEGPEEPEVALSAGGMLRCRLAAMQYRNGVAPFIMVSGGCVHPFKTKYNEAVEMKKFLMENLQIPERAILMEPHARHTTTNLRNCARLIFRYGLPMDKPCISSTAKSQSDYITGVLQERCSQELGYVPFKNGKRLSDTEAEFYPLASALQIDFDEPMDP